MKAFISHSSIDKNFVIKLAKDLRVKASIDAWLDQWEINPGDRIPEKIEEGLSQAEVFLLVLSPDSIKSQWVEYERQAWITMQIEEEKIARKENRPSARRLIPLVYKNCKVPTFINIFRYIEMTDEDNEVYNNKFQELVRAIRNERKESFFKKDITPEALTTVSSAPAEDPALRKQVFTLLKYLLPSQFQAVCFRYDMSCISYIPDNVSPVEKAVKLIQYAEQRDKENPKKLLSIIKEVINRLGRASDSIESKIFERLIILTSDKFDKILFEFRDIIPFLRSSEASLASRSLDLILALKHDKEKLNQLRNILDNIPQPITLSQSKRHYNEVRKKIYPHLNIVDTILAGIGLKKEVKGKTIDVQVSASSEKHKKLSLYEAIKHLWDNTDCWHCVLLGDGGMGKTTSLLKLWEQFLNNKKAPVPVFLSLEKYNQLPKNKRKEFIWKRIFEDYLEHIPSSKETRELKNQFTKKSDIKGKNYPRLILLLDGFNEVTVNNRELILCLKELIDTIKGVQLIITSRYDMRNNMNWSDFGVLNLEPLAEKQIEKFMTGQKMKFEEDLLEKNPLLRNPMMLTLYCNIEKEMAISSNKKEYDFINNCLYKAEMFHNFIISSLARLDRQTIKKGKKTLHRLYLRHLLPRIGYEVEKYGYFEISKKDLKKIIKKEFRKYLTKKFSNSHPYLEEGINKIKSQLNPKKSENILKTIEKLRENYCFLKELGVDKYTFLHQDFRDYFAAAYIKDKTQERINAKDNTFPELSSHVFKIHLKNMLGELAGEPRRRPVIKYGAYQKGEIEETVLDRALELLRNEETKEKDYRILNILEVLKEVRVDLSNTNLSNLDLWNIVLNNIILGRGKIKNINRGANLAKSRLNIINLFPQGHSSIIFQVNYNSNNHRLISSSYKDIREWDTITGKCIKIYKGHSNFVASIAYSPCEKKIISGSWDKTVKEWDRNTGKCIMTYTGHSKGIYSVCYSPDGKKIISGSWDKTIKEWDIINGCCDKTYKSYSGGRIYSVYYSPDGKKILSGNWDKTIKEWNVNTGTCIKTYRGHLDIIQSVCYSPDGKRILSGSWDKTIKEWDVNTGACIRTYSGHMDRIYSVYYSSNGKKILSGSWDKTIKEWDVNTGACIRTYSGHVDRIYSVCYSPDGKKILSGSWDKTIKEWDVKTGDCIKVYAGNSYWINSLYYSNYNGNIISGDSSGTIRLWDFNNNKCIKILQTNLDWINEVCHNPRNLNIILCCGDNIIEELDIETGEIIKIYKGHKSWVYSVIYSPDGGKILSGSKDSTIKEWEVKSGNCIKTYEGHKDKVYSVSYSPDGNKILSGSKDKTIREWDVKTGKTLIAYEGHTEGIYSVCYNMDGKKFLSGSKDNTIREWNSTNGKCIKIFNGHTSSITSVKYHPGEEKFLSGSLDNIIKEWDLNTGACIKSYHGHRNRVNSVNYNKSGDKFISGSSDNSIKEWELFSGRCINSIRNFFGLLIQGVDMRDLHPASEVTDEERETLKQYGAILD